MKGWRFAAATPKISSALIFGKEITPLYKKH
jgi:hypothetical protein